jgi:hypothetical protein
MIPYELKVKGYPELLKVTSAWEPLAGVIIDILNRFNIKLNLALEFGVERGYSTAVFANYFHQVIGVDPFNWTIEDGVKRDYFSVLPLIKQFQNIALIPGYSEEFMMANMWSRYDLIHIDIGYDTHAYLTTYPAGEWAVQHSDCVLFHDIFSFPEINQVCEELSAKYGFDYYGYNEGIGPAGVVCGLGILIKQK